MLPDGPPNPGEDEDGTGTWTFLTNHAHVLLAIRRDSDATTRELAAAVGITERATQRIVAELEAAHFITRTRKGRRNHYRVHARRSLRHPMDREHRIGELLDLLTDQPADLLARPSATARRPRRATPPDFRPQAGPTRGSRTDPAESE